MLRATPQLYAHPRPCSGSAGLMGQPRWFSPGHNRTHIVVCSLDTNRCAVLARILLDGSATLDAARAAIGHGAAIRPADLRVPAIVKLVLHPCQQAASHLPCTRPPDSLFPGRPRASFRGARRGSHYRAAQRAFVTTRSGLQTMPTGQAEDEIEDDTAPAPAVTGAAAATGRRYGADAGPGRRFKPAAPPRDLQDALAPDPLTDCHPATGLRHFRRSFTVLSATAPSSSRLRAHPSCWFTHVGSADGRPRTPDRIHSEDHIISQRFSPPSTGCISGGHTSLSLYW